MHRQNEALSIMIRVSHTDEVLYCCIERIIDFAAPVSWAVTGTLSGSANSEAQLKLLVMHASGWMVVGLFPREWSPDPSLHTKGGSFLQ